ncbi:MAG: glucose-6-phosphate isomerase family protein [Candidatus Micrarchaeia archaeon]
MDIALYDKPLKIELIGVNLFVNGDQHPKSTRTLGQMKDTMMSFKEYASNVDMYFMYRDVYAHGGIRFDMTLIPPLDIEGECAKTHGHYHPPSDDGLPYPEIYQVLHGNAVFILQKKNRNGSVDAIILNARERDCVLLPPGWGHVSVNNGPEPLVLSNLVYDKFESLYDEYDENRGAAYYYLKGGEVQQNINYIIQRSEHVEAKELNARYGFSCKDLLAEFSSEPKRFEFLAKPRTMFKG